MLRRNLDYVIYGYLHSANNFVRALQVRQK